MYENQKPFAESSEQNKETILKVLLTLMDEPGELLEIGSGTGQHAVFFSREMPHLRWQSSDVAENLAGINLWIDESPRENLLRPLLLDVNDWSVADKDFDYVFSANTVHIMSWAEVQKMFAGIGLVLRSGGLFCLYGPFNYGGRFTSESNARFDLWLKDRDPESGIRDLDDLLEIADKASMRLSQDVEMPVNNRILVWEKL